MIFSKKNHDIIRQNEKVVKKPHKHDTNLQKNSSLYFQIGLIVCLLGAYGLLEMDFLTTKTTIQDMAVVDDAPKEYAIDKYEIYKEPVEEKVEVPKKQPKYSDKLEVVKNRSKQKETSDKVFTDVLPKTDQDVNPGDIVFEEKPRGPINIMLVEQVPIFPGCEWATSNDARRQCMSDKMGKFIQRKFDTRKGTDLGLSGKQKIYVNFKINKLGEIVILGTSAPHEKLAEEANRVVNKLPIITPGQHGNKKVDVLYTLPITFQISN